MLYFALLFIFIFPWISLFYSFLCYCVLSVAIHSFLLILFSIVEIASDYLAPSLHFFFLLSCFSYYFMLWFFNILQLSLIYFAYNNISRVFLLLINTFNWFVSRFLQFLMRCSLAHFKLVRASKQFSIVCPHSWHLWHCTNFLLFIYYNCPILLLYNRHIAFYVSLSVFNFIDATVIIYIDFLTSFILKLTL